MKCFGKYKSNGIGGYKRNKADKGSVETATFGPVRQGVYLLLQVGLLPC